ncbi:MAG: hypothetical protein MH112_03655 [Phenylobacterium sp.]|uniref:hypothetical protein n=1 Tax=Phenylobacterium sp. TaxID=1871053 RepID=UPI0025CF0664|nr:hypothetical protein [Phenylobacterium sp.]MCG9915441.1 hypothetical protein [Phenylobacterium sp.]
MSDHNSAELSAKNEKVRRETAVYHQALGEMIERFSRVEGQLQRVLWRETSTPPEVAKAIFSGVRIDQARDLIRRTREARGAPESKLLARMFTQLGILNQARNDIVHFGAWGDPELGRVVTNRRLAHIPERVRVLPISAEILRNMSHDLAIINECIQAHLMMIAETPERTIDPEDWIGKVNQPLATYLSLGLSPWHYKQPSQGFTGRRSQKGSQG